MCNLSVLDIQKSYPTVVDRPYRLPRIYPVEQVFISLEGKWLGKKMRVEGGDSQEISL